MPVNWETGDRFRVKPGGGWDEHLWNKAGMVLTVRENAENSRGQPMVEGVMDCPSQHPEHPKLVVFRFFEYLDRFNEAVEKVDLAPKR